MPPVPPGAPSFDESVSRASNGPASQARAPAPATLTSLLDAMTPFVQAFDCVLMLFCGFYCLRSSSRVTNSALKLMAMACFVSALILLGFFVSSTVHGRPVLPLPAQAEHAAYIAARVLAPFELLLFALAIILVARQNGRSR